MGSLPVAPIWTFHLTISLTARLNPVHVEFFSFPDSLAFMRGGPGLALLSLRRALPEAGSGPTLGSLYSGRLLELA